MYGLETSRRRFLSDSLRARTPIPRLFLTGQDVSSPGMIGAMMGGVLAAAAIEPRALAHVTEPGEHRRASIIISSSCHDELVGLHTAGDR